MSIMSKLMDELIYDEKRNSAIRLLKLQKLTDDEIAEGLGIAVDEVKIIKLKELCQDCELINKVN